MYEPLEMLDQIYTIFSPNSGKYGPEKLRIRTLFTQWLFVDLSLFIAFLLMIVIVKSLKINFTGTDDVCNLSSQLKVLD